MKKKANNLKPNFKININYTVKANYTILSTKLTIIHLEQINSINTVTGKLS